MKMKFYTKYLMAPLSMLMVFACSPDQYQQSSEYDDVYFTRKDRVQQPEIIAQNEVVCWGNNDSGQTDVPYLDTPTMISVGLKHSCA